MLLLFDIDGTLIHAHGVGRRAIEHAMSDDADRYRLPQIALGRALAITGRRYAPEECVILGDTEHDVGCGRGAGMHTVAVCTGPHDRVTMEGHGADLVLDDFQAPSALFAMLDLAS